MMDPYYVERRKESMPGWFGFTVTFIPGIIFIFCLLLWTAR